MLTKKEMKKIAESIIYEHKYYLNLIRLAKKINKRTEEFALPYFDLDAMEEGCKEAMERMKKYV